MNDTPPIMDIIDYRECMEEAREKLRKQLEPLIAEARTWLEQAQVPYVLEFEERRRQIVETYGDHS